jgi:phosphate transport system substrate-binding protein
MKALSRAFRSNRLVRLASLLVSTFLLLTVASAPAGASGVEQIQGSGSSWAYNAISTWISDVTQQGLQVVFTPSGSAQGRQDYANGVTDFGVSDIGYQGQNPVTGQSDTSSRPYAYLPIVGGATTFPYNITVAGHRVENVRLSGLSLAKIFTDVITNWDDPEITADNNGHALPSIPIIPVVHSEGAGSTFQFTDWINTEYPALWKAFSGYSFPVEFWPTGKGSQVAENGSDGVMNFVASAAGAGSIGFDEYSYALGANFPVIALENTAGYFTMPDAYDAAVALTQAQINYTPGPNYLLETLTSVYTYNDPRTYPLSSYSYEILPTSANDPTMNTAKRQALANFDTYSICQGQSQMAPIGYSPLPVNLVEASFKQVHLLNSADPRVDVSTVSVSSCNNPTFVAGNPNENYLAQIAPYPPACAKAGQGPCAGQYAHNGNPINGKPPQITSAGGAANAVTVSSSGSSVSSGGGSSGAGGSGGSSTSGGSSSAGGTGTKSGVGSTSSVSSGAGSSSGGGSDSGNVVPQANPTVLAADHPGSIGQLIVELVAVLVIVLFLFAPATRAFLRRKGWRL